MSCLLGASATLLLPQKPDPADDDVILRAMRDELERSRQLRAVGGGDDSPITSATFDRHERISSLRCTGAPITVAISTSDRRKSRFASGVTISTTPAIFSAAYIPGRATKLMSSRRQLSGAAGRLWLATDTAYKTAVQSMSRKRAALNATAAQTEKLADFAHAEPVKSLAKGRSPKNRRGRVDRAHGEALGLFSTVSEVLASGLEFRISTASPTC